MRIISGELGGRRIHPPARMPDTRPTTDVAKEGLFNILENNLELAGVKTLDLFGGTGSISYELASRGAIDQTIVERNTQMYEFIKKTAKQFGLTNLKVMKMDVFRFLEQCHDTFDFIFAGPPYALGDIDRLPGLLFEKKLLRPGGWFVLEHTTRHAFNESPFFRSARTYGTTVFSIFIEGASIAK